MQFYPTLAPFAEKYDGFILDLWGVVHDGTALYPGVKECLQALRKNGAKIVFLSNAPRRAFRVEKTLNDLGIDNTLYDFVLSSGEVAYRFLAQPDTVPHQRYYYLGPEKDARLLDGLHYSRVMTMEGADFLLNVDVEHHGQEVEDLEPLLHEARTHALPMVCANPDMEVVKQSGQRIVCAGAVAGHYEKMGGEVSYFGKPYPAVYEAAFALLMGISREQIVAVGDNLDTDILGANQARIDCVLVTGGILAHDPSCTDPYALRNMAQRKNAEPTYVVPRFNW